MKEVSRMNKKTFIILLATAAIVAVAALILYNNSHAAIAPPAAATAQTPPTRITIAQAGDFYLYAPLYVAKDKGFFAKRGLDVSIVSTGGDDKTWAAVISESAQFGIADPTFIAIASQRGQPGKIIATIVNGVPFWGIAKSPKIAAISQPSGLNHYTVATFPSPSTAYTLQKQMFERAGLQPKIREGAFGTLLALVQANQADIALELEPNVSQQLENGYHIVYSMADVYGDFTITGLTTTPRYIQAHKSIVQAVVSALAESLTFIHSQPDECADLLARRFPEVKRTVAVAALRRVLAAGIIPSTPVVAETAWRKALKLRIDSGDLKPPTEPMSYVDNSFATH
jgi:NitT/TauT family transport system substrate-binding protein